MRSVFAAVLIGAAGCGAVWAATDGLRAFTAEGARRLAIAKAPRPLPEVPLQDQHGREFRLSDLEGRLVAVDFVYTRCTTFCVVLGNTLQRLQAELGDELLGSEVLLLSISFDPERDTPERLRDYGRRFGAGGAWQLARVVDPAQLPTVLDAFGITVIPDGLGGFEHNAAVHIVDRAGRLTRIVDFDDPAAARQAIEAAL